MSADKDTGVNVRAYGGFTVLDSTDVVVVSGQQDSPSLYHFPVTNHADQNQTEVPCRHVPFPLCLDINDKQYLVLSCDRCRNIKMIDPVIEEGKMLADGNQVFPDKPVFEGERVKKMCQGDKNTIYATVHGTDRVLELKWLNGKFTEKKRISTGIKYPDGLCYVPPPHRLIVVSDHDGGKIQAVWPSVGSAVAQRLTGEQPVASRGRSYEPGVIMWKLSGTVDGKRIYPRGLLCLHSRQSVLVADGERRRVLVVESETGSVLQTVRPDIPGPILSVMFDLCKYKNDLLVSYRDYPGYLDADSDDELPVYVLQVKSEEFSEGREPVKMKMLSSNDMDLQKWLGWTVMRDTGQVVVSGIRDGVRSLFLFSPQWGGALRETRLDTPCGHSVDDLLSLQIKGQEYLAVACWECKDIKLIDLARKGSIVTAFNGEKVEKMCKGEKDRLYVSVVSSEGRILELDCSGTEFKEVKILSTGLDPYSLCYASPHKLLFVCGYDRKSTKVTSCTDNKTRWVFKKEYDGKAINPRGFAYLRRHDRLLVADGINSRVLVLNPTNGDYVGVIDMTAPDIGRSNAGSIRGMLLYNGQIIMRHGSYKTNSKFQKMAYVAVN